MRGLLSPTQGDTCPQVSTADADENDVELCDYHDAHDTRDKNETVDVLPSDSLLDTATLGDTKVSGLVDEQRADQTLSGAFYFAKQNKGGHFLKKMEYSLTGRRFWITSLSISRA